MHDEGYSIFGAGIVKETNVEITGKNGANALKVIGQLAQHGKIRVNRIHAEASNSTFFNKDLLLKSVELNRRNLGDREFHWEKSKAQDENLNIRDIFFKEYELILDGKNYLEMVLASSEDVSLTLYIEHLK